MTSRRLLYLGLPLCYLSFVVSAMGQDGPEKNAEVDLGAFVKEIMLMKLAGNHMELAMWFPFDFFVESALAEGGTTRSQAERDVAFLKPYEILIVQRSTDDMFGRSKYADQESVRDRAVLLSRNGSELKPLDDIPPLVNATMVAMKTMISAEGDAGSANMHVLVFPGKDKAGKPLVDTGKRDRLTLVLKGDGNFTETKFTWRTPFDATSKSPPCSKCGEWVSTKWTYCPYCGKKQAANDSE